MSTPLVMVGRGYCAGRTVAPISKTHALNNALLRILLSASLDLDTIRSAVCILDSRRVTAFTTWRRETRWCARANLETRNYGVHCSIDGDAQVAVGVFPIAAEDLVLTRT